MQISLISALGFTLRFLFYLVRHLFIISLPINLELETLGLHHHGETSCRSLHRVAFER